VRKAEAPEQRDPSVAVAAMETLAAPHVLPAWVPTALTIAADRISKYRDVQTTLPTRASMVADLELIFDAGGPKPRSWRHNSA